MTELENLLAEARLLVTAFHGAGVIKDEDGRANIAGTQVYWYAYPEDPDEPWMIQFLSGFDDRDVPANSLTLLYGMDGKAVKGLNLSAIRGSAFQWLMWLTAYNRERGFTPDLLALMEEA